MYVCGKNNSKRSILRETKKPAVYEGRGMKVPVVTCILPEAGRSKLGQGEAAVKCGGGLKRFYEQVFF